MKIFNLYFAMGLSFVMFSCAVCFPPSAFGSSNQKAVKHKISACNSGDELYVLMEKALSGDQAALETLQKKSNNDDYCAQYMLGVFYKSLKFSNETEAAKWTNKALLGYQALAEKGDADAQYFLGAYYGRQNRMDMKDALKWWNKAAEQGHPEAQHSLGSYYTFGNSGKTDEGLKWLRKSANQGHVKAMFALGCYYDDAIVRTPKFEEAAEWYAKAAERNYPPAQKYLSNMYAQGEGVSQSWQKAYFWGCLSVRCFERTPAPVNPYVMSYPSRDHTDPMEAEKHLSRTDIETIRREASKWEPRTETR